MTFAGVTCPFAENWYFGSVLSGLRRALEEAGSTVHSRVVPWGPGSTAAAVAALDEDLGQPTCLGAVALGCSPSAEQAALLQRHGKPIVLTSVRSTVLPTVGVDDVAAGTLATRHLVDRGHRAITHLTGFAARAVAADDFTMRVDRARGYSDVMSDAHLDEHAQLKACDFESFDVVRATTAKLLGQSDRPTAIFAVTDEAAFAVLAAAHDAGLGIPQDLCVVGIDDHPRSKGLGLSTVRQSPVDVGAAAAARLLGRTSEEHQLVPLELVARATTGAAAPSPSLGSRLFRRRTR